MVEKGDDGVLRVHFFREIGGLVVESIYRACTLLRELTFIYNYLKYPALHKKKLHSKPKRNKKLINQCVHRVRCTKNENTHTQKQIDCGVH